MHHDNIKPRTKTKRGVFVSVILTSIAIFLILLVGRQQGSEIFSPILKYIKPKFTASLTTASPIQRSIEFRTFNGEESENRQVEIRHIPHLVLLRNGDLTEPRERTVAVNLQDFTAPQDAWALDILVQTQSGDPDAGGGAMNRIEVKKSRIHLPEDRIKRDRVKGLRFLYTFGSTSQPELENRDVTPSGYYRIAINAIRTINGEERATPLYENDHAFLMENQWIVNLPPEIGDPTGAGPGELAVYYMDMTPFQSDTFTVEGRMPRQAVNPYVENIIVPGMVGIIKHQALQWGFQWSNAFRGYRSGEDQNRISVALTDQKEWFHGRAPKGGYATLAINVHQFDLDTYQDVTDWILSIYSHELFHNQQRNLNLLHNGDGEPEGSQHAWKIVTEGTALLVESLMRQYLGTVSGYSDDPYTSRLRTYLMGSSVSSSKLNTSLTQLSPYEMVVYWRFLSESCQPARDNLQRHEQGLAVIRQTLDTLYADADLLNATLADLPAGFAELMDRVFANSQLCPYKSFRESLASFARSLYALRYSDAPCNGWSEEAECQQASPTPVPPAVEMALTGSSLTIEDRIASSYGIDFYEINLQGADPGSIELDFLCLSGDTASFQVELVSLDNNHYGDGIVPSRMSQLATSGNRLNMEMPCPKGEENNTLGVLITRVDPNERADPVGSYRLTIKVEYK
jgi:hypothetical protein